MAPTQHQSNTESRLNSCSADAVQTKSSSNVTSSIKSTASRVSESSSKSSTSSDISGASMEGRTSRMEWPTMPSVGGDSLIPIATRGLFHSDAFFEDARRHFDQAVQEVVGQWGQRSDEASDLDSYRKIRDLDLKDSNQAVSLSQDDSHHKVVLDVRDFMDGDVKVKILDENELVIEGSAEKKDGHSISKRSFCRRFTFPGLVKGDAVSSAMSSDGVLTVNVPKNNQRETSKKVNFQLQDTKEEVARSSSADAGEKKFVQADSRQEDDFFHDRKTSILLPISEKGSFFHDSFFESARQDFEKSVQEVLSNFGSTAMCVSDTKDSMTAYRSLREENLTQENQAVSLTEDETFHKVVLDVKDFMKGDVSVKVVDETEIQVVGKIEETKEGKSSHKSFQRSFTFPGPIRSSEITSAMSSDGILTVKVPKEKKHKEMCSTKSLIHSTNSSSSISSNLQTNSQGIQFSTKDKEKSDASRTLENSADTFLLPVFEKGHFFHDDFFASMRQDFERAVQEVMEKHGKSTSLSHDMTSYRSLREQDMREENQAISVTEDHKSHKVVMDVHDFNKNDLKIKVVDENELVVEGKVEKKEGESVSTKTFRKNFVFPGLVNSEAVSSSMSSDGVLIITIPKKQQERMVSTASQCLDRDLMSSLSSSQNLSNHSSSHVSSSQSLNHSQFDKEKSSFHDEFFAKAHHDFEEAANRVFNHAQDMTLSLEERNPFENICEVTTGDDDRTLSMEDDGHSIKVKIDVTDFVGGDLQVKALEQNRLLVEGRKEVVDNNGRASSKSFSRRMKLPGTIQVDAITSVLSKDGVLVVTAPKNFSSSTGTSLYSLLEVVPRQIYICSDLIHCENYRLSIVKNKHLIAGQQRRRRRKMAPTQHQSNTASRLNSCSADAVQTKLSSNVTSSIKSTASRVSESSSKRSTSSDISGASMEGRTSRMEWPAMPSVGGDSLIPIATRGLFHSDAFFEDARRHFDQAVQEVVGQWGQRSDEASDLDSYRKIRELDLKDSNQAVSLSQDDSHHKVVLDVRDFMDGDVKVKILDENELVIEGSAEKKDGHSISKRSFCRRFTFPGLVNGDAVSSAMSSDGVLTVSVPKNNQRETSKKKVNFQLQDTKEEVARNSSTEAGEKKFVQADSRQDVASVDFLHDRKTHFLLPISEKGSFFHDSFFENARQDFEKSVQEVLSNYGSTTTCANDTKDSMTAYRSLREENLTQENQAVSLTEDDTFHKVVLDVKDFMKGDVRVKVVDKTEIQVVGKIEETKEGRSSHKSFQRLFTFPGPIRYSEITSAMSSDGILTVKVPKEKEHKEMCSTKSSIHSTNSSSSISSNLQTNSQGMQFSTKDKEKSDASRTQENSADTFLLPVFEKGHFFHDDFFASMRQDFERAVQEVMEKHGKSTSLSHDMTSYRSLREQDMREENQAISVTEDHQSHKVVMDVHDFNKDDLKIKVVDENELVVEGKVEKKEGESVSTKTFHRKFVFPGLVNFEEVSSSMSSDGVLIITIPKKQQERVVTTASQCLDRDLMSSLSSSQNLSSNASSHVSSSQSLNHSQFGKEMSSFHDEFFAKAHHDFEEAADRVFNHAQAMTLSLEERNPFENICEVTSGGDDRTLSMEDDGHSIKVKIDVTDFVDGDLQVKALEQNGLLVEGRKEVGDNSGSSSSKSFSRRMKLPDTIQVDAITSVLSKDGVLVVTAPKNFS
ncbi:serine-rich adhesin for platelets-like [Macrobrachium nipponense]|uniref:serine-rich adhesin for platelets-like n=1 Tax=Macrobrachium nipponense TaxID=159736 RepID=UPI0030C83787